MSHPWRCPRCDRESTFDVGDLEWQSGASVTDVRCDHCDREFHLTAEVSIDISVQCIGDDHGWELLHLNIGDYERCVYCGSCRGPITMTPCD